MQTEIKFSFPLTKKVVRNLRIQTEQIGILEVEGYAHPVKGGSRFHPLDEQFVIDIDFINYKGTDIKNIIDTFADALGDEIHQKALEQAANHYYHPLPQIQDEQEEAEIQSSPALLRIMNPYPAA